MPASKAQIELKCELCGDVFAVAPSIAPLRTYCSRTCKERAHSLAAHTPDRITDKFWGGVSRGAADACWEWQRYVAQNGYGQTSIGRKIVLTHRLSYCLANGVTLEDIDGMCVMHACDNRKCVNPAHLSLGTYADNNADMRAKGRGQHGEKSPISILTEADVRRIRKLCETGVRGTQAALAREYGITRSTISAVVCGRIWKHVM